MSVRSDETSPSLLARVRDPCDDESWREFVGIYDPLLYRYARLRGLMHEDAREVVQECMAMLVRTMPGFEYSREKGKFKNWLRRIADNKVCDMFKRRRPVGGNSKEFTRPQQREASAGQLWEEQWQRKHLRYCLQEALSEVSPTTRQAFELYVVAEWPVERVTETLSLTADQVYAAKSRITQRLKKKYVQLMGHDYAGRDSE